MVIAYAMGTLYEKKEARIRELRETYKGVLHHPPTFHLARRIHLSPLLSAWRSTQTRLRSIWVLIRSDVKT